MTFIRQPSDQDISLLAHILQRDHKWVAYVVGSLARADLQMWVAERNGQLAAFLIYRIAQQGVAQQGQSSAMRWHTSRLARFWPLSRVTSESIVQPRQVGRIIEIYVVPAFRRQGIATHLLQQSIQALQCLEVAGCEVGLEANAVEAQGLLCKVGFVPSQLVVQRGIYASEAYDQAVSRPATRQDISQLVDLVRDEILCQQQLAASFQLVDNVNWLDFVASKVRRRDPHIRVIERGGKLVAFVELLILPLGRSIGQRQGIVQQFLRKIWSLSSGRQIGWISDLYVLPAFRGEGLATALVHDAMHWLQTQQVVTCRAGIWQRNSASQQFFQAMGFGVVEQTFHKALSPGADIPKLK